MNLVFGSRLDDYAVTRSLYDVYFINRYSTAPDLENGGKRIGSLILRHKAGYAAYGGRFAYADVADKRDVIGVPMRGEGFGRLRRSAQGR